MTILIRALKIRALRKNYKSNSKNILNPQTTASKTALDGFLVWFCMGASINYVDRILAIFDSPPLR